MKNKKEKISLDANQELIKVLGKQGLSHLFQWIAETAIFCPVSAFSAPGKQYPQKSILITRERDGKTCKIRRRKYNEKRGSIVNGVYLDDNTIINGEFKRLTSTKGCDNYTVCHIWQDMAYNPDVFCAVANLVMLPSTFANLSGAVPEVRDILAYRAYELYGWYPSFVQVPQKPQFYPEHWNSPADFKESRVNTAYIRKPIPELLGMWAKRPESIVYQTIQIIHNHNNKISRYNFMKALKGIATDPNGTIASLCTDAGHAYGKVFENDNGMIRILSEYIDIINKLW